MTKTNRVIGTLEAVYFATVERSIPQYISAVYFDKKPLVSSRWCLCHTPGEVKYLTQGVTFSFI